MVVVVVAPVKLAVVDLRWPPPSIKALTEIPILAVRQN